MTAYRLGKRAVRFGYYVNNVFSAKPNVGKRFNLDASLFVEKNENGNIALSFDKEKTYKIKEVKELYPGLYLVITTRGFHICFNAIKNGKDYKFAVIKEEPNIGKKLTAYTVYQNSPYSKSLGWKIETAVAEEVDDSFSKASLYILKAGDTVYLCTKKWFAIKLSHLSEGFLFWIILNVFKKCDLYIG